MTRTQIQLPDELYQRAKRFSAAREISLAEIARHGFELYLARFPEDPEPPAEWRLPLIKGGGDLKIPLDKLHELSAGDESTRSLPRK